MSINVQFGGQSKFAVFKRKLETEALSKRVEQDCV
jgi:hypothetical protein